MFNWKKEKSKEFQWFECKHEDFKTVVVKVPNSSSLQFNADLIIECIVCGIQGIVHPVYGRVFISRFPGSRPLGYNPVGI